MAPQTRSQTPRSWLLSLAIGIGIGGIGMQLVQAQPPATQATRVLQADLSDVPGKEVIMTIIDAQPGAGFPAHIHYGDEFVFVLDGSYERFVEQLQTVAKPGEGFHKMLRGNKAHTFHVNDSTLLANLRTGERVTVSYDKHGQELVARAIHPVVKK